MTIDSLISWVISGKDDGQPPSKRRRTLPNDDDVVVNTAAVDEFKQIPTELLAYVFSFLDARNKARASLVCRRWRDIIYQIKSLWSCQVIHVNANQLTTSNVNAMSSRGVRRVALTVDIGVHSVEQNGDFLVGMFQGLPNLERLTVGATMPFFGNVTSFPVGPILMIGFQSSAAVGTLTLPRLTQLDLTGCCGIDGHLLRVVAAMCPNIEVLCLINCIRAFVAPDDDTLWPEAVRSMSRLRVLNMGGCDVVDDDAVRQLIVGHRNSSDEGSSSDVPSAPLLIEELILDGCYLVTDEAVKLMAVGLPKLNKLSLYDTDVSNEAVKVLSTNPSRCTLTQLTIRGLSQFCLTNDSMKYLIDVGLLASLRELTLHGNIDDQAVELVGKASKSLHLECLNIGPSLIGDGGLQQLSNLSCLRRLSLSCCNITDDGIKYITQSEHLSSLKLLNIAGCYSLTDRTLTEIGSAKFASSLRHLSFANIPSITDHGVQSVVTGCFRLESIELSECIRVTDESMANIAIFLPDIRALGLNKCSSLTVDGIRTLLSSSRSIRRLVLPTASIPMYMITFRYDVEVVPDLDDFQTERSCRSAGYYY